MKSPHGKNKEKQRARQAPLFPLARAIFPPRGTRAAPITRLGLLRFSFYHNFFAGVVPAGFADLMRHFEGMALRTLDQIRDCELPIGRVGTAGPGFGPFAFGDSHVIYLRTYLRKRRATDLQQFFEPAERVALSRVGWGARARPTVEIRPALRTNPGAIRLA